MKKGVYTATKKDGTLYYRSSITFQNKHISLGSFSSEKQAATAYLEAEKLLRTHVLTLDRFEENCTLSFAKWVCLLNFRDNGMYIKTPICIFLLYHNDSQFYKLEVIIFLTSINLHLFHLLYLFFVYCYVNYLFLLQRLHR